MNFFQRRRILKRMNYLDLVPVRLKNEQVDEEGTVTIVVPKFKNERFARWFIPRRKSTSFRIKLDASGSEVWNLIDGRKSVGEISRELQGRLEDEDTLAQVETRVTKFITHLYDQRYVSFTILGDRS